MSTTNKSAKKVSAFAAFSSKIKTAGGETRRGPKKHSGTEKHKKIGKKFRQSLRSKRSRSSADPVRQPDAEVVEPPSSGNTNGHHSLPVASNGTKKRKIGNGVESQPKPTVESSPAPTKMTKKKKVIQQQMVESPPSPTKKKQVIQQQPVNIKTDIRYQEEPGTSLTMLLQETPAPDTDSTLEAEKLFLWLISPVTASDFFSGLWEKKPLLLKRHMPDYNTGLFSSKELHQILKENDIQFTTHLDVTSYTDGVRETHNPVGRAHAPVVWDFYKNGCSVRLLNPQSYSDAVWKFNSMLQEYFGSFVGANIYLTPAGSQGFAPHYDDIEAFVIQLEGKKHWRLYSPRNKEEVLPRFSSPNFSQDEIGEPIFDTVLEPGDLLYFPRGIIHQATTPDDSHSLHITLSTCQRNTWGDLLEKIIPQTLKNALNTDPELRKALPRDYMQYTGIANSDSSDARRGSFLQKVGELICKLATYAPVDDGTDQMAKGYIHDSLPPKLTPGEKSCSIFGNGSVCNYGSLSNEVEISETTLIRLIRRGVARVVSEDEQVRIYHTLENSRVYHQKEAQYFEIPAETAPAVEYLLHRYPKFTSVGSLPLEDDWEDKQVELAQVLYEKGILVTDEPLKPL
ncbi:ribosomal oxygenase 1-like isoform X2 [Asterias amurensis]|uniref:ribosomal oxygenase 1-like isoform X2 n=1 Tax=Asterias amurensis TaxID=7602 RepID=UPI003AB5CACD